MAGGSGNKGVWCDWLGNDLRGRFCPVEVSDSHRQKRESRIASELCSRPYKHLRHGKMLHVTLLPCLGGMLCSAWFPNTCRHASRVRALTKHMLSNRCSNLIFMLGPSNPTALGRAVTFRPMCCWARWLNSRASTRRSRGGMNLAVIRILTPA
jgi:hypothetical protein